MNPILQKATIAALALVCSALIAGCSSDDEAGDGAAGTGGGNGGTGGDGGSGGTGGSGGGLPAECPPGTDNVPGPEDASVSTGKFKRVSVGGFSCGIKDDDTLACWGEIAFSIDPPSGTFTEVSVGRCQACAISSGGQIQCWGCPPGDGGVEAPIGAYIAIAMGADHLCAIRSGDRALVCKGSLELVDNDEAYGIVASTMRASCATVPNAKGPNIRCWGSDQDGRATPPAIHATSLGGGGQHFCAVDLEGEAHCWGLNSVGQTDPADGPFISVDGTCGLRSNREIVCWATGPLTDEPFGCFRSLDTGTQHACAMRHDDHVVCWGQIPGGATSPP